MSATIEMSLYVGILKSRYDIFDDVILTLKDGRKIKGTIDGLEEHCVYIDSDSGYFEIGVSEIEDCEDAPASERKDI